jgi:hypothetical protein
MWHYMSRMSHLVIKCHIWCGRKWHLNSLECQCDHAHNVTFHSKMWHFPLEWMSHFGSIMSHSTTECHIPRYIQCDISRENATCWRHIQDVASGDEMSHIKVVYVTFVTAERWHIRGIECDIPTARMSHCASWRSHFMCAKCDIAPTIMSHSHTGRKWHSVYRMSPFALRVPNEPRQAKVSHFTACIMSHSSNENVTYYAWDINVTSAFYQCHILEVHKHKCHIQFNQMSHSTTANQDVTFVNWQMWHCRWRNVTL